MQQQPEKFSFNIMDAAGYGYYRVWVERDYLFRLALVPFLVKFACTVAIFALELDDNVLRQGLVMLPAMFAEGWVIAQFLRTLLMNERWPIVFPKTPDLRLVDKLLSRARGIIASVLSYVLLGMLAYFLRYTLFEFLPSEQEITEVQQGGADSDDLFIPRDGGAESMGAGGAIGFVALLPAVLSIVVSVWLFRFMWIYIPLAVLMPLKGYVRALSGFMSSVYLLILFFSCMAPASFLAVMLIRVVYMATGTGSGSEMVGHFLAVFLSVAAEILVGLVTTAAFAWAMRGFLPRAKGTFSDFPSQNGGVK